MRLWLWRYEDSRDTADLEIHMPMLSNMNVLTHIHMGAHVCIHTYTHKTLHNTVTKVENPRITYNSATDIGWWNSNG